MENSGNSPVPREEILSMASALAARFAQGAAQHDAEGTFPHENIAALRECGFPALSVPVEYGGWGAGLLDCVMALEQLATGDGSTALAVTMHVQTLGMAALDESWEPDAYAEACREAAGRGALINSCATEPEMGSPSRGGRPATTARRDGADWAIDGIKTFATMAPALDYFIIPATAEGIEPVLHFLVPRQDEIEVEETWDALGMRATGSHTIRLNGARVPDQLRITRLDAGGSSRHELPNGWFALGVSAVYVGIASAAQMAACHFARDRVPTALGKPIATLESVQRRLGQAEYLLQVARGMLRSAASEWDQTPGRRAEMGDTLTVAKLCATNNAVAAVDCVMRVVGGASMSRRLPFERYYRDVRAGLFHPPFDDTALPTLGQSALNRLPPPGE
jgi:alkylation response protein AidB-like acyl-CoA dehydrogenase